MVIFDLDGTLVDSAAEILAAMDRAWSVVAPGGVFPRERFRIGPPLGEAIAALAPGLGADVHAALAAAFRATYDACDFSKTVPYPGVAELVETLASRGVGLAVATNKRHTPTMAILAKHFPGRFPRVACIDGVSPDDGTCPGNKRAMLAWLSRGEGSSSTVPATMVGDAASDVTAARAVGLRAVAVTWGYEDGVVLRSAQPDALVHDPASLLAALLPGALTPAATRDRVSHENARAARKEKP